MSLDWILLGLRLVATVTLYIFLAVAMSLIWRQLRQAQASQSSDPVGQMKLSRKNNTLWLENLDGQSGIKLNDKPLSESTPLSNGDVIEVSGVKIKLEITE